MNTTDGAEHAPLKSPRSWAILLGMTGVGLVLDLWSKAWAFRTIADTPVRVIRDDVLRTEVLSELIPRHAPQEIIPGLLDFTLVLNPGAVFGLGAGQRWLFVGFTVLAIGMGLWMFARWTTSRHWLAHLCLGLVFAGGLGNLYDRVVFGCVRDFIHPLPRAMIGSWEIWPYVGNVADKFLIIGIAGLMWHLWRTPDPQSEPPADESTATADTSDR